jgi:hypothetical protein
LSLCFSKKYSDYLSKRIALSFKVRKAATRNELSAAFSYPVYLVRLLLDFQIAILLAGSAGAIGGNLPRAGFSAIGPNAVADVVASLTGHA